MALSLAAVLVITASVHAAGDEEAIKQAYVTYLQARIDRDIPAAQAASTGDDLAKQFLELDIQRQSYTRRVLKVGTQLKMSTTNPAATMPEPPKISAAKLGDALLKDAQIDIQGDTATVTPKNAKKGFGFKRENGVWKADLYQWQGPAITPELVKEYKENVPLLGELADRADKGEFKSSADLERAMQQMEMAVRAKHRPTSGPSTMPGK